MGSCILKERFQCWRFLYCLPNGVGYDMDNQLPCVVNINIVFHIYVYFLKTLVKLWFPTSLYVLNVYIVLQILYCRLSVIAYYLYVECLFRSINTYFLKVKGITLNTSKLQVRCLIFLILPRSGFVNKKRTKH